MARRARTPVASVAPSRLSAVDRLRAALAADDPARVADAAIEVGPAAHDWLSEPMTAALNAVLDAFELYQSGHDDGARERLQAVGLGSPFLDWKLLLRGLIAFAGGDDGRALDNWSRLAADRLPARLVAPLRFALDAGYRVGHAPAVQATLQRHSDRFVGGVVPVLRAIQGLLPRGRLADAFRHAEAVLPELRRDLPHAVGRLGDCFRAAIVSHGEPADVGRYRQLFGAPPDDPTLARLEALAAEDRHAWAAAHKLWQRFERSMVDNPAWPAADRDRARAMVWCRMGRNAAERPASGYPAAAGRRLTPTTEACYARAAELAPDLLEPHELLVQQLREKGKPAAAIAAGNRLLTRFPEHGPTLVAMAELCRAKGDVAAGLDFARRALAANPLDRRLRGQLADAHRAGARAHAAAGDVAAAANDLDAAQDLCDGRPDVGLLAQVAVVAFKAGHTDRGEERVKRATNVVPVAAAYALAAEAARAKLPRSLKQRFEAALTAALAGPATAAAAAAVAAVYLDQSRLGGYLGQKAHEKKVQVFAEAAVGGEPAEGDLTRLCERVRDLGWWRLLKKGATHGQKHFPRNPFFPYFEAVAHLVPETRLDGPPTWKVEPLLEKARRLAENWPPDDAVRDLLRELDDARRRLRAHTPVVHMLNELFEMFDDD